MMLKIVKSRTCCQQVGLMRWFNTTTKMRYLHILKTKMFANNAVGLLKCRNMTSTCQPRFSRTSFSSTRHLYDSIRIAGSSIHLKVPARKWYSPRYNSSAAHCSTALSCSTLKKSMSRRWTVISSHITFIFKIFWASGGYSCSISPSSSNSRNLMSILDQLLTMPIQTCFWEPTKFNRKILNNG